jgi:creatinine amidohydrolase
MENTVRLEDLNWMDVEEYLKHEDRLIMVLGATEQHGYLSLLTDVKIPMALADSASQQTGVLVAPPLNFGCSPYFLSYPGTFSLRVTTFIAAVEDLVRSAYGAGFRRLLILNGHGGNSPARTLLAEIAGACRESSFDGMTGGCPILSKRWRRNMASSPLMPTGWRLSLSPS